jgi:hypothetical protein
MNALIRLGLFALMLVGGSAFGQSKLPACPSSGYFHNCFGIYTFPLGEKYIGEFKDDRRHGFGTHTFADGRKYVGDFMQGRQHGQGIEYDKSGNVTTSGYYQNCKWEWGLTGSQVFRCNDANSNASNTNQKNEPLTCSWIKSPNGQVYSCGSNLPVQPSANNSTSAQTQSASNSSLETDNLRREANALRLRQSELEEQQRALAQQAIRRERELEDQLRIAKQQQSTPAQLPASNIPAFIGKRIALVVGNANYRVRPLMNSRNDADDVSRALKVSGFEVIDVRDGSLSQMRTAVRQFGDKLLTNDVGLVYYSGHGIEVKGRNYFIPVNADIQREDEIADQGLDVALILEKMNTAQRSVNIMIVDACRDDPFGRSFRSSSRGLATMEAPRGTIIAYATSPGKVASDGDPRERNSPYTKHLLRAMQAPNKPIEQVFKEVRRAVQDETKNQQTPWENTSLSGDFYFKVVR